MTFNEKPMRACRGKCAAAVASIIPSLEETPMILRMRQTAILRGSLAAVVLSVTIGLAGGAHAQQYQNFEVTPDGRGGAQGTIGGRNFEVYRNYDRPPAGGASPETRRELRRAVPQQTCVIDSEGRTRCK
ncbi:hypothetical protein [Agrobacterium tumefaciens]|uniref:hypothetical protein n=1 Tax=Agrobacterium tumefaciens TaxID=358 RepID=UPI001F312215|nr:hypothetical protein [Agrobacterium tumefaciens]WCK04344.1 hypothetical protein G6L31_017055 [Agrobacterium tumefaciens]